MTAFPSPSSADAALKTLTVKQPFHLESGEVLPELTIAYHTFGKMNEQKDNVVWICHALTGNSNVADWWSGLVGEGKLFDPKRHFIVCANMLGSCYGTTGPASIHPETGLPFGDAFPLITVRDMVRAHQLLQRDLGIGQIALAVGGSMGGQQVLEWAVMDPANFRKIVLLATNARHSPWGIAFNEAQRMAIEADLLASTGKPGSGQKGLEAARAIAMLSYRNYQTYYHTQQEGSDEKLDGFRASQYQRYQGLKLQKRFDVFSYLALSKAMDNHHVGRGRGGVEEALRKVKAKTLVIGIQSDVLFPVEEQVEIANYIPDARLELIHSAYGHDGFLVEDRVIGQIIHPFWEDRLFVYERSRYKLLPDERSLIRKTGMAALPGSERF